ncbi:shikimate kinase [Gordonia malaquae]|uniref:Shikimate kinase n=1 Tax=Gordonia malaquae NBRC 108250 TaxID=1223542 RepID=M3UJ38_GORML|nr:shikimate kinase [Gordonia malaquae]GAC79515.1 shikimate kinase [Gordonia malaquae NBRC 108250]SED22268.1 shikimate kinase [Gordonia malaquae]
MTVVVLAGFMGSGKSTVGRAVADRLGLRFVDTDIEIERRSGRTIPEIFDADGEAGFRAVEADVVRAVLAESTGVVALGGGSPTVQAIREALVGHHVVYLEISADDGFARVNGSNRPLLSSPEPAARYEELLHSRVDAYESVAGFTVDATRPVDDIVTDIIRSLHEAGLPQEDS